MKTFRASHPTVRRPRIGLLIETLLVSSQVRGGGIEPPSPGSKPGRPTTSRSPIIALQSALRESNPPRQLGRLAPLPLGQGHIKAEGEGVEPSRLIARPLSRRLPSPIGLPFRIASCGGRNRTCVVALNRRLPVPTQAPPQSTVRTAGFEPAISCSRSTRNTRLSYVLIIKSAQRESNPHFRHGKAAGCRYIMGASESLVELSKNQEHRAGLEPTSPHYGCGILAAGRPVPFFQWDQRDSNPHLTWLRARCAAANTLIPFVSFTSAASVGAEGIEPSTWSL